MVSHSFSSSRRFRRVSAMRQPLIDFNVDRSVNVRQVVADADPIAQVLFMKDDVAVACQRPNWLVGQFDQYPHILDELCNAALGGELFSVRRIPLTGPHGRFTH